MNQHQSAITSDGFTIIDTIYTSLELRSILGVINFADQSPDTFRKTQDLFAIRRFLVALPQVVPLIFTKRLQAIITRLFGKDYFVVKSIYFDKPAASNWFVAYHQDLTISVDRKAELTGYGPWTVKQAQHAVRPPLPILEQNFTIRIHLDDTDAGNGALRVIPGSHLRGISRPETVDWNEEKESVCSVSAGSIMIMRPLLLHASKRADNSRSRRVIHIEFSRAQLPEPLKWSERISDLVSSS